MKNILVILFSFACTLIAAQNAESISKEIKEEGVALYQSEMASWYGTDVFKEGYDKMDNVGGYFSYVDKTVPKCIFFSKNNKVIATISFPANFNPKDAKKDFSEREFTATEYDYFSIRQRALTRVQNDTIFKNYKNASLNLIPVIKNNTKKVYVITGPSISNIVIFGNDYLITFNDKNDIQKVEKLHQGMIVQKIKDDDGGESSGGAHSHILENWQAITPTDICTLMLYQRFTNWENYTVVSKKYISLWDSKSNNVSVMTSEDYDKMNKEEEKK
ncbi:hypothetical protein [Chryseobacterium sp. OV279]|uniref:hypothetical protein n=1 Tax=Chryseobacterium sp. OV279 TaxID=1500285 RepID=UPI00090F411D|nr:hypothetical protein [Chryseobacterium sp. OV279]SHG61388.1 hypothetical protein SAMN02787100_4343 [Chryseobacterium sp. OV279]